MEALAHHFKGENVLSEDKRSVSVLTDHNPIGKDEELYIWSKGTEH